MRLILVIGAIMASGCASAAQPPAAPPVEPARGRAEPAGMVSVPISAVRYDVTFDSATADRRTIEVAMSFSSDAGDVLLSLPAWTPGAYEIQNFARFVTGFSAMQGSDSLRWDKADHDTWRVRVPAAGAVSVRLEYRALELDNAAAWAQPDFAFFNGTNLFLYPEGLPAEFPAAVVVRTEPGWRVVTSMPESALHSFTAADYHELVDHPFFVGRFDIDSVLAAGRWTRLASYPAGVLQPSSMRATLEQFARMLPPQVAIFNDIPWTTYTVLQVADEGFMPGSAAGLEHGNSHLNIVSPIVLGNPALASLYAHEFFHAWNVKRLRPAGLWPYRYDRPQPTALLWISEGVTDYYADLTVVRSGVGSAQEFYAETTRKIEQVEGTPAVSLEDASLSAWIKPVGTPEDIYYTKGAVAGLLLDILIRDASNNAGSLDTVLRELYERTYQRGTGFTNADWWQAVSQAAGGRSFAEFERRYIDGREPLPYDSVLPLAGLRLVVERTILPSLGISITVDGDGARVVGVAPGGAGSSAGVRTGDYLLTIGGLDVHDPAFGQKFNAKFAGQPPGGTVQVEVRRGTQRLTLSAPANFTSSERRRLVVATDAPEKAVRVRRGIIEGR